MAYMCCATMMLRDPTMARLMASWACQEVVSTS
jgi:hypothetical protein